MDFHLHNEYQNETVVCWRRNNGKKTKKMWKSVQRRKVLNKWTNKQNKSSRQCHWHGVGKKREENYYNDLIFIGTKGENSQKINDLISRKFYFSSHRVLLSMVPCADGLFAIKDFFSQCSSVSPSGWSVHRPRIVIKIKWRKTRNNMIIAKSFI